MKNISKKFSGARDIFEDYATRPVPSEKRFSWLSQGMVWSGGTVIVVGSYISGAIPVFLPLQAFWQVCCAIMLISAFRTHYVW